MKVFLFVSIFVVQGVVRVFPLEGAEPEGKEGRQLKKSSRYLLRNIQLGPQTISTLRSQVYGVVGNMLERGVYVPDERFNPFVDGVMVNMVEEVAKRGLDPLYFRVTSSGDVEHVSTIGGGLRRPSRTKREEPLSDSLGGGVVKGLSDIRRFSDASVQMAGNVTLIRSSWIMGPLTIIIDYRGNPAITRVKTKLQAVQFDTLTSIDRFGAAKEQLRVNSPLFEFMPYYGNRTLTQQKITELVVKYLFSDASFMIKYLDDIFAMSSFDKIIPQFGAGGNYYSVLEYLFTGQGDNKSPRISQITNQPRIKPRTNPTNQRMSIKSRILSGIPIKP